MIASTDEEPARPARLGPRRRYGYAAGNFGKSLQNSTHDLFFLFYLVDYLGAPPALAGGLLFAVALIDCVADLVIGHLIDQSGANGPSYRVIIGSGALAGAAAFLGMFLWPLYGSGPPLAAAILWLLVFRLAGSAVDVPHNALLAALTRDSRERGRLSTLRFLFSSGGNLAVSGLIALTLSDRTASRAGLCLYVGAVTLLYLAVMFACVRSIGGARSGEGRGTPSPKSLVSALGALGRNGGLVKALGLCMLAACLITLFSRMTLFFAQSSLGDPSRASMLVSVQIAGQMVSLPVWGRLQARLEKRSVALIAHAGFAATMAAFLWLSPSDPGIAACLFFLAGTGLSGLTVMHWAIVPDMIEYTERSTGLRHEALTFGLLVTLIKLSSGAGAWLVGLCLEASSYRPTGADAALAAPGILLSMTALPFAGAAVCILILSRLRISYRAHADLAG